MATLPPPMHIYSFFAEGIHRSHCLSMSIGLTNLRSRASATEDGSFTVIRTPEFQPAGVTVYHVDYPIPNMSTLNISRRSRREAVPGKRAPDLEAA